MILTVYIPAKNHEELGEMYASEFEETGEMSYEDLGKKLDRNFGGEFINQAYGFEIWFPVEV